MATSTLQRTTPDISGPQLRSDELRPFQELMYRKAGIRIADAKINLVQGRLRRRLDALGLTTYRRNPEKLVAPQLLHSQRPTYPTLTAMLSCSSQADITNLSDQPVIHVDFAPSRRSTAPTLSGWRLIAASYPSPG